jgi:hypothetical protein
MNKKILNLPTKNQEDFTHSVLKIFKEILSILSESRRVTSQSNISLISQTKTSKKTKLQTTSLHRYLCKILQKTLAYESSIFCYWQKNIKKNTPWLSKSYPRKGWCNIQRSIYVIYHINIIRKKDTCLFKLTLKMHLIKLNTHSWLKRKKKKNS